jgi:DNA-binding CsgD family transcriptional regulator
MRTSLYVDGGRALVYVGFALGLALGFLVCEFGAIVLHDKLINVVGGVAVLLLVVTLMAFLKVEGADASVAAGLGSAAGGRGRGDAAANEQAGAGAGAHAGVSAGAEAAQTGAQKRSFKQLLEEVASTYQLSQREFEVFALLAKGRNAEYIQNELVISRHTAKTHIANIYRKLDVHSAQEVLDRIESFKQTWQG